MRYFTQRVMSNESGACTVKDNMIAKDMIFALL